MSERRADRLLDAVSIFWGDDADLARMDDVLSRIKAASDASVSRAVDRTMVDPYSGWHDALGLAIVPNVNECAAAYQYARSTWRRHERNVRLAYFLMLCSVRSADPVLLHDVPDEFDLVGSYLSSGLTLATMILRSVEFAERHASKPPTRGIQTRAITPQRLREMAYDRRVSEFEVWRACRTSALRALADTLGV